MKLTPLADSTLVTGYGYDPATKVLRLSFKTGKHYDYSGVEAHQFRDFEASPSKGTWFHANLGGKNKERHPFSQVTPEPEA